MLAATLQACTCLQTCVQAFSKLARDKSWTPAFAGVTAYWGRARPDAPSPPPLPHHEPPQPGTHHRVDDDADGDQLAEVGLPEAAEELHHVPQGGEHPSRPSSRRKP